MITRTKTFVLIFSILLIFGCAPQGEPDQDAIINQGDGTIINTLTNRMWTLQKSKRLASAQEAQNYAAQAVIGGYDDWRLPTLDEFHTLYYAIDFGQGSVRQTGISAEGNIWVVRENDGKTVAGAWERDDTCCISRTFIESKKGRVWLIRP